jgi:fatty acid desaturase
MSSALLPNVNDETTYDSTFSLAEARKIVTVCFSPKQAIYWADFLGSFIVGNVCFALVRKQAMFSWQQIGLFFAACMLFYRCVLFIHELVHLRNGTFTAFRIVWNLLCGITFLIPSFMYYTHLDHHRRKMYGTAHDGEYIPLGQQSGKAILVYLLQPFFLPILAIFRFMILTPLTWVSPWVRRMTFQHASSMIMEPKYVRPMPTKEILRIWRLQEFGCFVWCWGMAFLIFRGLDYPVNDPVFDRPLKAIFVDGVVPPSFLPQVYLTSLVILFSNAIRTLGAHRFLGNGGEMTFVEQLLDSVNYPRWPLVTGLWAPVGLRYHALHHLFPSLPYHNLDKAHAMLMRELPADSPYRQVNETSLFGALWKLWKTAQSAEAERQQVTQKQ